MTRIPRPLPAELDAEQRRLYDVITSGSRSGGTGATGLTDEHGRLEGQFNAMLLNPPIGDALQHLGVAIRYRGRLSDRSREIAILAVAAHWECEFEQRAHEPIAAQLGLSRFQLDALQAGRDVEFDDPAETAVLRATQDLLRDRDMSEDRYGEAVKILGAAELFELTTLVGYYSTLALQMRVFAVT